ncbi:unnamed protein product [Penicillium salamii]|uniref:F-box domain-containing protein n=1 Tax=Penicillium salamii TaxID=1612424 RepID=A0A9W4IU62_9EURO|nr:unnamed protein product [Penicillium salamii]CAG8045039.1 unnamed protein product [Penicillium salamii]CAG8335775.1 unnamed protein product [Penicillium salamii]CAG8335994.1 unnamed protein product [Penicillium salamii]CAG8344407.1 unnamed protein product [Penicillium salamii]
MDPFAKLPTEIIWQILESCDDFTSLEGLQQVSPQVEQAFNGSYKTITESILRNCSHASRGLHGYFTLLVSIQSMPFTPAALLGELLSLSEGDARPVSLPATHTQAAVRQTVATAAKIHRTACACLRCLLNRLEAAEPRLPLASSSDVAKWAHGRHAPPKGGQVIQFNVDPPSWIESYRTHRGLWTLELLGEIHNAATKRWMWSVPELNDFIEKTYLKWCDHWGGLEELETISECVIDLSSSQPIILRPSLIAAIPPPNDLMLKACWPLPTVEEDATFNSKWHRAPHFARTGNNVGDYFNMLRGGQNGRGSHPLWKVDFKAFRKLGIPLWDNRRLNQMGIMPQPRSGFAPMAGPESESDLYERPRWSYAYTWFSLAKESEGSPRSV